MVGLNRFWWVSVALLLSAYSPAQETDPGVQCVLPLFYRAGILQLNFDQFHTGNQSWRVFASRGCGQAARALIQDYLTANEGELSEIQRDELMQAAQSLEN